MKNTDTKQRVCPGCGRAYRGRPALSRKDNRTLVCEDCGTRDALESIGIGRDEQDLILAAIHRYCGKHGQN